MGLCNRDRCPDVDGQFRLLISRAPRPAMGPIEMKRILTGFVAVAAIAAGLALPAHALTPSPSPGLAATARGHALARATAQAPAKTPADAVGESTGAPPANTQAPVVARRHE